MALSGFLLLQVCALYVRITNALKVVASTYRAWYDTYDVVGGVQLLLATAAVRTYIYQVYILVYNIQYNIQLYWYTEVYIF